MVRNRKECFKKLKIKDLRAGMILNVAVEAPPVPEGEPAQIAIDAVPIAKGGKPKDEESDDAKDSNKEPEDKTAFGPNWGAVQ